MYAWADVCMSSHACTVRCIPFFFGGMIYWCTKWMAKSDNACTYIQKHTHICAHTEIKHTRINKQDIHTSFGGANGMLNLSARAFAFDVSSATYIVRMYVRVICVCFCFRCFFCHLHCTNVCACYMCVLLLSMFLLPPTLYECMCVLYVCAHTHVECIHTRYVHTYIVSTHKHI
jgi:hypothetical protein